MVVVVNQRWVRWVRAYALLNAIASIIVLVGVVIEIVGAFDGTVSPAVSGDGGYVVSQAAIVGLGMVATVALVGSVALARLRGVGRTVLIATTCVGPLLVLAAAVSIDGGSGLFGLIVLGFLFDPVTALGTLLVASSWLLAFPTVFPKKTKELLT